MKSRSDRERRNIPSHADETDVRSHEKRRLRTATGTQKRLARFSLLQLVREFELMMLAALVETARRDRSA